MNAIQRYQYDRLQELLKHLQKESETLHLPIEHLNEIVEKQERLNQLYINYQSSLLQVFELIQEYEQERRDIKCLMNNHRNFRKNKKKTLANS